jgi:hypothetical protein
MCIQFIKLILKLKFNLQCYKRHFIGIFQEHLIYSTSNVVWKGGIRIFYAWGKL